MIFLIIILLFTENYQTPKVNYYLSNCNYKGLIEELEKNDYLSYVWPWYYYNLKAGDFKKLEKLEQKLNEIPNLKKVLENKKYEIELLNIFYKEKDYSKVIDYMKNYLKIEEGIESLKRIHLSAWLPVLISCIIKNEKDLLDYIKEKIKIGIYYALAHYYLYKKLPEEMEGIEHLVHPDKQAFLDYMKNKIKKEELIEKIMECYKDLPVWLDINIEMIKALP